MNIGTARLVALREIRERGRCTSLRVGTVISLLVVAAAVAIPALRQTHRPAYKVGIVGSVKDAVRADLIVRPSMLASEDDALAAVGRASTLDLAISAVITLVGVVLLMRVAAKIYNRTLLRTGRRLKVREVLVGSAS